MKVTIGLWIRCLISCAVAWNECSTQSISAGGSDGPRPVQPDTRLGSVMFDIILKFLQTPGQVLLVQAHPGSGKTTFALEILNSLEETHKIYASSRVAPARLRLQFPWIDEVIDTMSGRTARASWIDELHDLRRVEPDTIFNQVLRLKHSKQRAVLVVDSWEGAIRNTNDEGRKMLESAVLSELDESKVSVVIVVEDSRKAGDLGYLVDGIITLDQSELDGRRVRTIAMNKLRGFSVPTKRGIFSLDKARFTILPNGLRQLGLTRIRNPWSLFLIQAEPSLSAAQGWTRCLAARSQGALSCSSTLTAPSHQSRFGPFSI